MRVPFPMSTHRLGSNEHQRHDFNYQLILLAPSERHSPWNSDSVNWDNSYYSNGIMEDKYCNIFRGCVNYKTGFGFHDRIY
jgi:hypothetical protein